MAGLIARVDRAANRQWRRGHDRRARALTTACLWLSRFTKETI